MDNIKNDFYYLTKIINDIEFILKHTENLELHRLETDDVLTYAICFKFTQISESCSKLSSEYKETYIEIPWRQISGLRNLIVHDYGNFKLAFNMK